MLAAGVGIRSASTTRRECDLRDRGDGERRRDVCAKEGDAVGEERTEGKRERDRERGREGRRKKKKRGGGGLHLDIYAVRTRASCLSA